MVEHAGVYPVRCLCRALGVTKSGYYAWRRRGPSRHDAADRMLQRRITQIHAASQGIYGSPKIHQHLRQEGVHCSRKRVVRLMQQAHLRAKRHRLRRSTTQRNPSQSVAPNRLQQQFSVRAPNQVWLADITYVPTAEGWVYLAAVLDLFSRRVLGWAMDAHMTETLVHRALRMAIAQRGGCVQQTLHHSDRGSQYTSADYQALLAHAQMTVSMSGTGNCYDNAPMESFFSLLKTELVHHQRYATRQQAKTSIFGYIEVFYNRQRLHSAIGYLTPLAAEQQWQLSPARHAAPLLLPLA